MTHFWVDRSLGDDRVAEEDWWSWGVSPSIIVCATHLAEREPAEIATAEPVRPEHVVQCSDPRCVRNERHHS